MGFLNKIAGDAGVDMSKVRGEWMVTVDGKPRHATSPEVCEGVVMERKKSINSILRMPLVSPVIIATLHCRKGD